MLRDETAYNALYVEPSLGHCSGLSLSFRLVPCLVNEALRVVVAVLYICFGSRVVCSRQNLGIELGVCIQKVRVLAKTPHSEKPFASHRSHFI